MNQFDIISLDQLDLLAKKIVEGYLIGLHRSPYHGFSVEFREHRLYNTGDPIKSIDQKVLARTDKMFVKKYDEETNLRCYFILDISESMNYPKNAPKTKLQFSVVAIASLMHLLKKQRDAFGLITYAEALRDYIPPKLTEKNKQQIYASLNLALQQKNLGTSSNIIESIESIIPQLKTRNLLVFFTDFLDSDYALDENYTQRLSKILQQLLFKKHEIIIFNILKSNKEILFEYEDRPTEFVDVETGERLKLASLEIKDAYRKKMTERTNAIRNQLIQMGVEFVPVSTDDDYRTVLESFLRKRAKMK